MKTRRITFAYMGVSIDIGPADVDENPAYRASCHMNLSPLALASKLGRLEEGTAEVAMARCFADGVIIRGEDHGEEMDLDIDGWIAWLIAHPDEYGDLREIAGCADNFKEATA